MHTPSSQTTGFHGLGIAPALLEILGRLGLQEPTPIQSQAIPVAIEGNDIVGIAQTGTGKTLAFGVPMLQRLAQQKGGRGLVLLPTRELAVQVEESLKKVGASMGLRTAVLIGGVPMGGQYMALRSTPHVIIATPGRLIDHMEQGSVRLNEVKILVLDEADRMLDMGFAPQLKRIFETMPEERQTMLFSATMPTDIVQIARKYMKQPTQVEIARQGTTADTIAQELFIVRKDDKLKLISSILKDRRGSTLIFSRTKHGARKLCRSIRALGYTAAEIHSDRTQGQRQMALQGFRTGSYRVLVATDIAARGIDVKGIELVINFDLPDHAEDYVHRIGRTGRAGLAGTAISFASPDQLRDVKTIERLIRIPLPVKPLPVLPELPPMNFNEEEYMPSPQRGGGGYQRSTPRTYAAALPGGRNANNGRPYRGKTYGSRAAAEATSASSFDAASSAPRAASGTGHRFPVRGPRKPSSGGYSGSRSTGTSSGAGRRFTR